MKLSIYQIFFIISVILFTTHICCHSTTPSNVFTTSSSLSTIPFDPSPQLTSYPSDVPVSTNTRDTNSSAVWSTFFVRPSDTIKRQSSFTAAPRFVPITQTRNDQPFGLHFLFEHEKKTPLTSHQEDSKPIETVSSMKAGQRQFNQHFDDDSYFTNVHSILNKIYSKILHTHGPDEATAPVLASPIDTDEKVELPDKSKLRVNNFKELLQTDESVRNENTDQKPAEYFINISPQTIPIRIRFNTMTSQIRTEQNHVKNPGQVKKLFTMEQPDRLIHLVKKPIIQEIHEVITPYRNRLQMVEPLQEQVQTRIAKNSRFQTGNQQHNHNQQQTQQPQYQTQSEPKTHEPEQERELNDHEFERVSTNQHPQHSTSIPSIHQMQHMQAVQSYPKPQREAINPTENLSNDIELDKIIANLIRQQDVANTQNENQNRVVYNKNRFSNVEFSKPDSTTKTAIPLTSPPTEQPVQWDAADQSGQQQFYQQLTHKLQNILQVKTGRDALIQDLSLFLNSEPEIQKRKLPNNIEMSHGFVPITPAPRLEQFHPMESLKSMRNIPVPGTLKLSKVYFNPTHDPESIEPESIKPEAVLDETNAEPDQGEHDLMLGSGTEEEIVEILNSGDDKKVDTSMEFVNTKKPVYRMNDGRQMVEEYYQDVIIPNSYKNS